MASQSPDDGETYLLKTREGSLPYVVSTVEKYYEELLTDVLRNPSGYENVVLCTTTHSLPSDAFRRITEVEEVVRLER